MHQRGCQASEYPFNRTSLELKQVDTGIGGAMCKTFNRTSLELKPARHLGMESVVMLAN